MASIIEAFGLPITVARPEPDDGAVPTSGIWILPPLDEARPVGGDFQRREPRKVMAIPRDAVLPSLPRGSTVLAAEALGGVVKNWRVDGFEQVEADQWRVRLVLIADP